MLDNYELKIKPPYLDIINCKIKFNSNPMEIEAM